MMMMMMMTMMVVVVVVYSTFMLYCEMLYSAYLRPSRELLEYYRKKIAEFDDEHESVLQRLDQYKMTYEEQVCKKPFLCIHYACMHFQ